ncbi:diphosphomevalonate decarboxylase-like [Asterias rubens]|uniref:diphosphomevalonate decarboxylase-like n=1 Tax=Asterias rubens TaxID=7604 RepID=UPI001455175A|nr:diphosphomevalonate decarboxylase-like [Asterias rubens]
MEIVTCRAPVNIAVIKYWGKRNEKLILPVNSSLSATLHIDQLCTKTTVAASNKFKTDRIWLNGREESLDNPRLKKCLAEIRQRARKRKSSPTKDGVTPAAMLDWKVHICSENNFPTAAGLASSAAGYACLVATLAKVFKVEGNVSDIARQGSGSACRSMYGGFVQWLMGEEETGEDSIAEQVVTEDYWPEMRILILVVSDHKKATSSTAGMQSTVETSPLLPHRAEKIVPDRMVAMTTAIEEKDFKTFAELTMKDSNQFHAVCLDTYPPISYMNDTSRHIVRLVHAFNAFKKQTKAAYTFDAGPNAVLFTLENDVSELLSFINHFLPQGEEDKEDVFIRGLPADIHTPSKELQSAVTFDPIPNSLRYIIHTKVGPGPVTAEDPELGLIDSNGQPKSLK